MVLAEHVAAVLNLVANNGAAWNLFQKHTPQ